MSSMAPNELRSVGVRLKASSFGPSPLTPRRGRGISCMNARHKLRTLLMSTKVPKIAFIALLFGIFAGCVPSWNPLFTEKDLIFDQQLIGTWKGDDGETWTFEKDKDGEKHYQLSYTDKQGKATLV